MALMLSIAVAPRQKQEGASYAETVEAVLASRRGLVALAGREVERVLDGVKAH